MTMTLMSQPKVNVFMSMILPAKKRFITMLVSAKRAGMPKKYSPTVLQNWLKVSRWLGIKKKPKPMSMPSKTKSPLGMMVGTKRPEDAAVVSVMLAAYCAGFIMLCFKKAVI